MTVKNNLQEILNGLQISVTNDAIKSMGLTKHRWNQILANVGRLDVTVAEKNQIELWLHDLTQKQIDIFGNCNTDLISKHHMVKA